MLFTLVGKIARKRRPLGSLSNNDHDGYENVTKKVTSRCLKLDRAYSISFNSTNADNFFGVEFKRTVSKFRKRKIKLLSCVPVLDKT